MSVIVTLHPITPELLAKDDVKRWLDSCDGISIPDKIVSARKPTLAEVQEILSQLDGCTVKSALRQGIVTPTILCVSITKPFLALDGQYYGVDEYCELHLWNESGINPDTDLSKEVEIMVERESLETLPMFVQKLANICGTYLVLGNGEPDYFVTPKNSAP